ESDVTCSGIIDVAGGRGRGGPVGHGNGPGGRNRDLALASRGDIGVLQHRTDGGERDVARGAAGDGIDDDVARNGFEIDAAGTVSRDDGVKRERTGRDVDDDRTIAAERPEPGAVDDERIRFLDIDAAGS